MAQMISYCGMICTECQIMIATTNNDNSQKQKIASTWSAMADILIKPEEVVCDGCKKGERYFGKCQDCIIRECGASLGVETCGHCKEYPCAKLKERLEFDPSIKERLDDIKMSK